MVKCHYKLLYYLCQILNTVFHSTQAILSASLGCSGKLRSKAGVKLANVVQHGVTVDHTMVSGVAKLSNLRCSTMCDNVYSTMLKGYVKLTYLY